MATQNSRNSSQEVNNRYQKKEYGPKPLRFFDSSVPGGILELLAKDYLTKTDFLILTLIDSLGRGDERGCRSTNEQLATVTTTHSMHVSKSISKLQKLGLIKVTQDVWSGVSWRYLQTTWKEQEREIISNVPSLWEKMKKEQENKKERGTEGGGKSPKKGGVSKKTNPPLSKQKRLPPPVSRNDYHDKNETNTSFTRGLTPPCKSKKDTTTHCRVSPPLRGSENATVFDDDFLIPHIVTPKRIIKGRNTVPVARCARSHGTCSPVDKERATILSEALAKKGHSARRKRLASWADQFRLLREEDKYDEADIHAVLEGYCKIIDQDEWVPQAYCAKSFREKFLKIKRRLKRDVPVTSKEAPLPELDEIHKGVLERLENYHWPKGSRSQLHRSIFDIEEGYSAWRAKLITFRNSPSGNAPNEMGGKESRYRLTAGYLLDIMFKKIDFAEFWLRELNKRVCNWPEWSGVIPKFSTKDKHFVNHVKTLVEDYTHDSRDYDAIERALDAL